MKLMLGIFLICIGLVIGLPYLPIPQSDSVADSEDQQSNPFVRESQSADAGKKPNSFSNEAIVENEFAAKSSPDETSSADGINSVAGTIEEAIVSNDKNEPADTGTLNEPVAPVKVTPQIDIAAYPGQTLNRSPVDHKWSSNKFLAKPVAAVANPHATGTGSNQPMAAAIQAKLPSHSVQANPAVISKGPFTTPVSWHRKSVHQEKITSLENLDSPEFDDIQWNVAPQTDGRIKVVLFIATWSKSCESSIQRFNSLYSKHSGDIEFLGLFDAKGGEDLAGIVDKWGIKFPVAIDADGEIQKRFHSHAYPSIYVIDGSNKIRCANIRQKHLKTALIGLLNEPQ